MSSKPVILVTNDDDITAPGIHALVDAVSEFAELLIVAPDRPQSGMGHAITVNDPLRLYPSRVHGRHRAFACSGTPVDCVKLGIFEILKRKPALVVSGINHGANSSTNVLYSGTMSAAVEGAMEGVPSIGFSLTDYAYDADFSAAKEIVKRIVKQVINSHMPENICYNVNIPAIDLAKIKGIRVCRQARAFWEDKFDCRKDPLGKAYYWLTGEFKDYDGGDDTDLWALNNGYVSLVPVQFDMTAYHVMPQLHQIKF